MIKNRWEKRRREPAIIFSNTLIHTPPCLFLKKAFSPVKMSKVKTSKGAVWEGFCPWHVCKTQHARSQMTEVSVEVTCHKWPIMGYTRSWTSEWGIETVLTGSPTPSLPNPHVVCRQLLVICFPHYLWAWNRLHKMGFAVFCQLGKKLEKIGVPIVSTPLLYGWWGNWLTSEHWKSGSLDLWLGLVVKWRVLYSTIHGVNQYPADQY